MGQVLRQTGPPKAVLRVGLRGLPHLAGLRLPVVRMRAGPRQLVPARPRKMTRAGLLRRRGQRALRPGWMRVRSACSIGSVA